MFGGRADTGADLYERCVHDEQRQNALSARSHHRGVGAAGAAISRLGACSARCLHRRRDQRELRHSHAHRGGRPAREQHLLLLPVRAHQGIRRADAARRRRRGHRHRESRRAGERAATNHRLPLSPDRGQLGRCGNGRRPGLQNREGAALTGNHGRAQPDDLRGNARDPGHPLGHRQRQRPGVVAEQPLPLHAGIR